jgi:hypothetical protein
MSKNQKSLKDVEIGIFSATEEKYYSYQPLLRREDAGRQPATIIIEEDGMVRCGQIPVRLSSQNLFKLGCRAIQVSGLFCPETQRKDRII